MVLLSSLSDARGRRGENSRHCFVCVCGCFLRASIACSLLVRAFYFLAKRVGVATLLHMERLWDMGVADEIISMPPFSLVSCVSQCNSV